MQQPLTSLDMSLWVPSAPRKPAFSGSKASLSPPQCAPSPWTPRSSSSWSRMSFLAFQMPSELPAGRTSKARSSLASQALRASSAFEVPERDPLSLGCGEPAIWHRIDTVLFYGTADSWVCFNGNLALQFMLRQWKCPLTLQSPSSKEATWGK
jgi:hypothetical protein